MAAAEEADPNGGRGFDELVPRWMFIVRPWPARLLLAFVVPGILAIPLALVEDPPALRMGPLLVLGLVAVAAVAGWWPTAVAGVWVFLAYWRYAVPPFGTFELDDTSGWTALIGMGALAVSLPLLTRRAERAVDDVRALDEQRSLAVLEEARLRSEAEAAATQVQRVLDVATSVAGAHTVRTVAQAVLDAIDTPAVPATASVAIVQDHHLRIVATRGVPLQVAAGLEDVDLRSRPWVSSVLDGQASLVDDRERFGAEHPTEGVLALYPRGSWAVIPFRSQGTTGLLSLHHAKPQPLTEHRLYFTLLAEILATALEGAQAEDRQAEHLAELQQTLAERDRIARTLSTALLPPALPRLPGFSSAAWLIPGSGDVVAGDFYDLFSVADGDWVAVLGDVCGKGAEAAAVTSLARYAARVASLEDADPRRVADIANTALTEDRSDLFCTMVVVRWRRGEGIEVTLAGHLQARLINQGGVQRIGMFGAPLGLATDPATSTSSPFEPGDVLVVFSDGLVERDPDYGEDALDAELTRLAGGSAGAVAAALRERVTATRAARPDDVAVLVISRDESPK